jgi:branched-chain amino acid transport system permease protein
MKENHADGPQAAEPSVKERKYIKPGLCFGLVIIMAILPLVIHTDSALHVLILDFIFVIAAVSMRTIIISGQFPLGHAAFMGIGAYAAGMTCRWLGWPPWITIPFGAVVASCVGMMFGYPFARLRALYYAMGSLFFGIALMTIISSGGKVTGGYSGLTNITSLFGSSMITYYYFFLGLTLLSVLILYRIEFSRIGSNFKAIAQSHKVASSVGINESGQRILAMGIGCFFAGLAGAGYAHYNLVISPVTFNFVTTLWIVMYVLIGGIESFAGPIIGTFILVTVSEFSLALKAYSPYISAAILAIVAYLMPQGLVGLPGLIRARFTKRRESERDVDVAGD